MPKILKHPFFSQQFDSLGRPIKDNVISEVKPVQYEEVDDLNEENSVVEPDEEDHFNCEATEIEISSTERNFKTNNIQELVV